MIKNNLFHEICFLEKYKRKNKKNIIKDMFAPISSPSAKMTLFRTKNKTFEFPQILFFQKLGTARPPAAAVGGVPWGPLLYPEGAHGAPYFYPAGDPGPPTLPRRGPWGPVTIGLSNFIDFYII